MYNHQDNNLPSRQGQDDSAKPPRAAVDIDAIPAELKDCRQWVFWRYKMTKDRDDWTKVPVNVETGANASSTEPKQWCSFEDAIAHHRFRHDEVDGIGFVFDESDPYVGIDLDDCIDPATGAIEAWAKAIIVKTNSYAEVSPSGQGVKIWCRGSFPNGETGTGRKSGDIEVYRSSRYFTVTGCHLEGTPTTIEDGQRGIDAVFADYFSATSGKTRGPVFSDTAFQTHDDDGSPPVWPNTTDEQILDKLRSIRGGDKFSALYDKGDISSYGNDQHPGDFALISRLAFGCGSDANRIDRLFRQSKLMRRKWDRPWRQSTYGRVSINRLLQRKEDFYDWSKGCDKATDTQPQSKAEDQAHDLGKAHGKKASHPVLREEALYGLAGDIVRAIDPHTEADKAGVLTNILGMFGNAVGPTYHSYADGSRHGLNVNFVHVGDTNSGKGTATHHAENLMGKVDPTWLAKCKVSGLSSGEGLISKLAEPENPDVPSTTRRLLVVESEFGGTLTVMKREGNSLSSIIRQLFDGNSATTLTKTPMSATGAHTSLIAHITPIDLRDHLSAKDASNGFANRFLWVSVQRSKELPDGGGTVDDEELVERVRIVLDAARAWDKPVWRDHEAAELWAKEYGRLTSTRSADLDGILGRSRPLCLRLSLLYAAMDGCTTITRKHLEAALALWDYCEASAALIFGGREGSLGEKILHALRRNEQGLTPTEITVALQRNVNAATRDAELDVMLRNGLITVSSITGKNGQYVRVYRAADRS